MSTVDAYQTPLGMVPLSPMAAAVAKIEPFAANPPCQVDRPNWWPQSSKTAPPVGEDTPETWEHSLEVQLPFLQRTLHDFRIVPVIFGQVDSHKVAEKLLPFLDDQTLIVVSTDLSHYHPYDEAKALDTRSVAAICDLRGDRLTSDDACGYAGVVTLIDIARRKGWKTRLLDYRNSGDTAGNKSAVVGYAAIAMFGPDAQRGRLCRRPKRRRLQRPSGGSCWSSRARASPPRSAAAMPRGTTPPCRRSSASVGRVSSR